MRVIKVEPGERLKIIDVPNDERFQSREFPFVYKHWKPLAQKKYEIW